MTNFADPATVRSKAKTWTPEQINCRLTRHAWDFSQGYTIVARIKGGGSEVRQNCARGCGVWRTLTFNRRWIPVQDSWTMHYPKEYLNVDDDNQPLGRIDVAGRAELWKEATVGLAYVEVADE